MTGRWRRRAARPAAGAVLYCLAATGAQAAAGQDTAPASNAFLANVPLESLDATRERPLFRPSRRPFQPAAPAASLSVPAVQSRVDEPPRLTLLGIIRAPESVGSAVVMDEADRTSVSLRLGESRRGWVVRAIGGDTVTLQKEDRTVSLSFPKSRPATPLPAE